MRRPLLVIAISFMAIGLHAQAKSGELTTGAQFLATCTPPTPSGDRDMDAIRAGGWRVDDVVCTAYVEGVFDGIDAVASLLDGQEPDKRHSVICLPPEGVTALKLRTVVTQFIQQNKALAHLRTNRLIFLALSRAFPCQAPQKPTS